MIAQRGRTPCGSVKELWRCAEAPAAALERLTEAESYQALSLDCRHRDPASRIFVSFMPFALAGDWANVSGQFLRMEQIITETGAAHETKDQYFLPADGSGTKWLAKRYSYVRRI